ncbi:MAG TPA: M24 family metallopeptidase, partial [Anaerolineales bacterium]|nr:M24 family metallopeptidase [Anaerolineales bacterium]
LIRKPVVHLKIFIADYLIDIFEVTGMESNQTTSSAELNLKLERIRELLIKCDLDALLLQKTENFAWATCGGDAHIYLADSLGIASLLITRTNHFVVTNNIEATRLRQEGGLGEQGWEFKVSPWLEGDNEIASLTHGMKFGADTSYPQALDLSREIASVRSQLTPEEGNRFRELGQLCAQGMRQSIEAVKPGMSEYEIAGLLAQSVESKGVQVVVNLVATDERIFSYRHPLPSAKKLRNYAMLVLCGRKWGLICSLTRLVNFGKLPDEVRHKAEAVALIDAEMIAATRPGRTLGDIFRRAQAVYAASGYPGEWQLHHQGGSAGYAPREVTARPTSAEPVRVGQAFAWNPSITGTKSEDTILVGEESNEIITEMAAWPSIDIQVGEQVIKRPAILEK